MPKEFDRAVRVGDMIQRELSVLIRDKVKDPRVGMVTVSAVDVNKDLSIAKVYFTLLAGEPKETTVGLNRAAGFLRSELARISTMRTVPSLRFYHDDSAVKANHLSMLIEKAVREDRAHDDEQEPQPSGEEGNG